MRRKKVIISFGILCLSGLNACSYISVQKTAQPVETEKSSKPVPLQALNEDSVTNILKSINQIVFLSEDTPDPIRKQEFYIKLNDYICSDKMDYTVFACNRYGKLICLDLDYLPQIIEQKESHRFY